MSITKPAGCVGCPLYDEGKGFVPGDGPLSAEVWLWLQAPGEVEVKQGKPVVGPAGQLLWRIMASLKKDRSEFRIENTVRCQPPKKNGQDHIPAGAVEHCTKNHSPLHSGQTASPKIIVTMGNEALSLFTGKRDIEKWRGSLHLGADLPASPCVGKQAALDPSVVYKSGKRKGEPREVRLPVHIPQAANAIMPTYHPSALKKGAMHLVPVVMKDVRTALDFAAGTWERPILDYKFVRHPGELQDWDRKERKHMSVAVDIETDMKTQEVLQIALSDGGPTVVFKPEPSMLPELAQILSSREMMAHNGISFDFPRLSALLKRHNPMMRTQILGGIDTMLGWSLCEPDLHKRLSYAAACVKNDTFFWKEDPDFVRYNARDAERCWHVGDYVAKELKRTGQMDFFIKIMQPAYDKLADATLHGIRKDEAVADTTRTDLEQQARLAKAMLPPELEWSRPAKVAAWLTANGVKAWGADNKGGPSSQAALHKAKLENPQLAQTIDAVLKLRNIQKTISTYLNVKTDDRGLIHPHFLPGDGEKEAEQGTATQRVSCRDPNIQNVPQEVRKIFVPTHLPSGGWDILTADFVQIEWRLTCYFANHMEAAKGDIHKRFAANLLGKTEDLITDAERKMCKAFVYGKIYGMGKRTMREWLLKEQEILMAESDCERHLREVTKYMPWLDALQRETTKEAIRQGYIANPYGVRRYFYSEDDARKALNTKIQGTAACMLLEVLARLPENNLTMGTLWATIHDELDFEVRKNDTLPVAKLLKHLISTPNPRLGGFSVEPKFSVGPSWGELTDYAV